MSTIVWQPSAGDPVQGPDAGHTGATMRQVCTTLVAGSLGQVCLTLQNKVDGTPVTIAHVSIGVAGTVPSIPGSFPSATFNELKFGGSSGVTLALNVPQTSDWVNLSFASSDTLIYIMDMTTDNVGYSLSNTNGESWDKAATSSYNTSGTVSGFTQHAGINVLGEKIETQAGAATITLMGAICL